jgi:hypothetical protein
MLSRAGQDCARAGAASPSTIAENRHGTDYAATTWRQARRAANGWRQAMKILAIATALLALIAAPAHAQMGGKRHHNDDSKTEAKKPPIDDKAYKAALEKIPEPKEKYDPWGIARPADPPAKKPK